MSKLRKTRRTERRTPMIDYEISYELDQILSVIGGLVVATLAAIAGVLTLAYGYVRWAVARRVRSLRTYLKEDQ